MTLCTSLLAALLLAHPSAPPGQTAPAAPAKDAAQAMVGDPYPLDTCIVSGEKLGADAKVVVLSGQKDPLQDGRQIKFCCPKCEEKFAADPTKFLHEIDAKIIAAAGTSYPLDHCLVMKDEALKDDAKTIVHGNRVYKFCCKKCIRKFESDPAKWAAAYDAAVIAKLKPGYPLDTCPISGKKLGDGAVDIVIGTRLVRTCCPGCVGAVKDNPAAAFAKIDAAAKAKKG